MAWRSGDQAAETVRDEEEGVARIPLFRRDGTRTWVTVDLEDLPKVSDYRWYEARGRTSHTSYAHATVDPRPPLKRETVPMHRLLLDAPAETHVDHIDGDGLNNRRSNLRVATPMENRRNEIRERIRTNGPFKGVQWNPKARGWIAQIGPGDETHRYLGIYDCPCSAALAYDDAAREEFGEFAQTNFTLEQAAVIPRHPRRVRRRGLQKHGLKGYTKWGCRCEVCRAASSANSKRLWADKKAKRASEGDAA